MAFRAGDGIRLGRLFFVEIAQPGRRISTDFDLCARCGQRYVARMSGSEPDQVVKHQTGEKQVEAERRKAHPEQFCPNCSARLKESRCKLSCPRCEFYLSCSDYD